MISKQYLLKIRYILLNSTFFVLLSSWSGKTNNPITDAEKPNILFILVDDLRPELGCYGITEVISPNIDSLAKEGTMFTKAYAQAAHCLPSRTSLLSGVRPENFKQILKEHDNLNEKHVSKLVVSMPKYFKNNGYTTISIGKIYHNNGEDESGWTKRYSSDKFSPEGLMGYASGYQNPLHLKMVHNYLNASKDTTLMDSIRPPSIEIADKPDSLYPDGKITNLALNDLAHLSKYNKPFFLAVGYYRPHLPFTPPKKYWEMYDRNSIELANNPFLPKNGLGFTEWDELRRYGDIPRYGKLSNDKARELIHGYYASISFIDTQIGILLNKLKSLNLDKNTIVIICGDHGWNLGDHGLWCKHTNYETSNRTTLIVKAPYCNKGKKTDALSGLIDIYPTLCDLCGLGIPSTVSGISLKPILLGESEKVQDQIFSFFANGYSMRTNRYRFTYYLKPQKIWNSSLKETAGFYELYDHKIDPDENINIAYDVDRLHLLKEMEKQMSDLGFLEKNEIKVYKTIK